MRRLGILLLLGGCASQPAYQRLPHDRLFQRVPPGVSHPTPAVRTPSFWWDAITQSTLRPLSQSLSPGYYVEQLIGVPEAFDVNNFGQVVDSSWFSNRITKRAICTEELQRRGPYDQSPAPGPLTVVAGKFAGATPGLVVQDAQGATFVVKFDPPAFPQLSSGAELIATRILWAAGYHVPENAVGELDLERLRLAPGAQTPGPHGQPVPFTAEALDAVRAHVNPYPNNRTRALFSRYLPGSPIGPFSFRGIRPDDPNDRLPHEDRRSLRALWMFSAWINNVEPHQNNTLDTFVTDPGQGGRGHVEHALIDFGDALGAAGTRPKYWGEGYEAVLDWPAIGTAFFSLGIHYPYWLPVVRAPYRSVGFFEAEVFSPSDWRPSFPNPAFDRSTPLDDYWAASIVARFTPDVLAAIVRSAGYAEAGAEEWVLRVLTERQYALLEHAFARVLPLDDPEVQGTELRLRDLAVETNLREAEKLDYAYQVRWDRDGAEGPLLEEGRRPIPTVALGSAIARISAQDLAESPFLEVRWSRPEAPDRSVRVHLRIVDGGLLLVGLDRDVD